jgi:RNA polymerase sigma factor (sigma-70 family)
MDRETHGTRSDVHVRIRDAALASTFAARPRRVPQTASKLQDWKRRSETWGCLMVAAQGGDSQAYAQLMRELDAWLRRYYARRLPHAAAADARQEALLAIHAKRSVYIPSTSFGAWVAAIARFKWIDRVREVARSAALSRHTEMPAEDHWDAAISAIVVHDLLRRLTPAQASAIRLVKLEGVSVKSAASATGQSESLLKVNIHRGLKRLASLVAHDEVAPTSSPNSSHTRHPPPVQIARSRLRPARLALSPIGGGPRERFSLRQCLAPKG